MPLTLHRKSELKWAFVLLIAGPASAVRIDPGRMACLLLIKTVNKELRGVLEATDGNFLREDSDIELAILAEQIAAQGKEPERGAPVTTNTTWVKEGGPALAKCVAETHAAGGEIEIAEVSDFYVRRDGTPVIRLKKLSSLEHEMDHFRLWHELQQHLINQDVPVLDASQAAYYIMHTPLGNLHTEARAALIDLAKLKGKPDLSAADIEAVLERRDYPFLSALDMAHYLKRHMRSGEDLQDLMGWLAKDTEKVIDGFLKEFDKLNDKAHADYKKLFPQFLSKKVHVEFLAWVETHPHWIDGGVEEMPLSLRMYAKILETSPGWREGRVLHRTTQFSNQYAEALATLILTRRIPPAPAQ